MNEKERKGCFRNRQQHPTENPTEKKASLQKQPAESFLSIFLRRSSFDSEFSVSGEQLLREKAMDTIAFEETKSSLLTTEYEGKILLRVFNKILEQVRLFGFATDQYFYFWFQIATYELLNEHQQCLFCFLFVQMSCYCWLLKSDVRYVRDCILCKCCKIYQYKFKNAKEGELASIVLLGNNRSDHLFICDVCLASNEEKCQILCSRRNGKGRCWPTFHQGRKKHCVKTIK